METDGNDLCPCGSGKKFKNCCLKKSTPGWRLDLKGKSAEEFVYELSKKSFLEDWCYKSPKLPNGKEICDLLIVFGDIAIIWQIKDLKLDEDGKYNISDVQKNIDQLDTARNRLFEKDIPIELENPRRGTELFNPKSITRVFLISALLGKGEEVFSLVETVKGRVVHIFTRIFTEIILKELDAIKDFIEYLREKENLMSVNNKTLLLGGEQELLAYYLMNERSFSQLKEVNFAVVDEGYWDDLQKRPEYIRKKEENEISYLWDEIINRAHTAGKEYEIIARELARTDRFQRRLLSKAFFEAHIMAHNEKVNDTFRRFTTSNGVTYCFLFLDDPEPREFRKATLAAMCFITRGIVVGNQKVIGIATEMKIAPRSSFDFCLLEIPNWTEKEQMEMERLQKDTGIFTNFKRREVHEDEYPKE